MGMSHVDTSRAEISDWFDMGFAGTGMAAVLPMPLTHMLVVCDTWDWSDFPVYVSEVENLDAICNHYTRNDYKVMEIYDLARDRDTQLGEFRAKNT